ncbi:MAG: protein kinase [Planctomycetota bacterium]|nr:protein kinase [Planctomycetota bacterium]
MGPHGRGGVGRVSRAIDHDLQRDVALKELRTGLASDPRLRRRFLSEAVITGYLEHPGIVPIYALGWDRAGRPYYAMKFVEGQTLDDAIERLRDPLDLAELRPLLRRVVHVCQAIAFAHSRGVIHRDLKPTNIMLGEYGETLVLDWGLAKRTGQPDRAGDASADIKADAGLGAEGEPAGAPDQRFTLDGAVLGTPAYMPPEQALGKLNEVGPASDVYSLGAVLYRTLTKRAPHRGDNSREVLARARDGRPDRPRALNSSVPAALEAVCQRAMAPAPADRYASAADLARDIERWLDDEPVSVHREGPLSRLSRWSRRHPARVAAIAALVFTALVAAAVGSVVVGSERAKTRAAQELADANAKGMSRFNSALNRTRSHAGMLESLAAEADAASLAAQQGFDAGAAEARAERLAVRAQKARAEVRGIEGAISGAQQLANDLGLPDSSRLPGAAPAPLPMASGMALVSAPAPLPGLRSWTLETTTPRASIVGLAYSPDSRLVATAGDEGVVRVFDAQTAKQTLCLLGHDAPLLCVAWSPDGTTIASGSEDGTARIFDAGTGLQLAVLEGHRASVRALAWSPDSRQIVTASYDTTLRIWDVERKLAVRTLVGHTGGVSGVDWSPDGSTIASSGNDLTVRLWDPGTGQQMHMFTKVQVPWTQFSSVHWTPDSRYLLWPDNSRARLWDAKLGQDDSDRLPKGISVTLSAASYAPDGKALITSGSPAAVIDLDTGKATVLFPRDFNATCRAMGWSPDGKSIAVGDERGSLWFFDAETRKLRASVKGDCKIATAAGWAPDNQTVAIGTNAGVIEIWDLRTPAPVRSLHTTFASIAYITWATDAHFLAASSYREEDVEIFDSRTGVPVTKLTGHKNGIQTLAWAPGRPILAVGSADGRVRIWDVSVPQLLQTLEGHKDWVRSVAWSPDGTRLVSSDRAGQVRIWTPNSETPPMILTGHEEEVRRLAWAPDGKTLASGGLDKTIRVWDSATGKVQLILRGHRDRIRDLVFTPDGREIVSIGTGGTLHRWLARWGDPLSTTEVALPGEISPDGSLVIGCLGAVRVWETRSALPRHTLMTLQETNYAAIGNAGDYVGPEGIDKSLVFVAQSDAGQKLYTPAEFASTFHWSNSPPAAGASSVITGLSLAQGLVRQIEAGLVATPDPRTGDIVAHLKPEIRNTLKSPVEVGFAWHVDTKVDWIDDPKTLRLSPEDAAVVNARPTWTPSAPTGKVSVAPGQSAPLDLRIVLPKGMGQRTMPMPDLEISFAAAGMQPLSNRIPVKLAVTDYWRQHLPEIRAKRVAAAPRVDGILDEAAWRRGPDADHFHRLRVWGASKPDTAAWIAYDDEALYVAFRAMEADMPGITLTHDAHDSEVYKDDSVEFFVNTHPREIATYHFIVNAAGVLYDDQTRGRAGALQDVSWESHAAVAAHRNERDWTAEIAIPWRNIGLAGPPSEGDSIRVNFCRNRHRAPAMTLHTWAPMNDGFHELDMLGWLRF